MTKLKLKLKSTKTLGDSSCLSKGSKSIEALSKATTMAKAKVSQHSKVSD